MFSTHTERKSIVAERFIRTLKTKTKTKTYQKIYMTFISKIVYVDKLSDIVNE